MWEKPENNGGVFCTLKSLERISGEPGQPGAISKVKKSFVKRTE